MAAEAFLAMRARIRRHIDQRTAMLASVSHDLRTPLTRLKLQAAMSPPSPRMEEIKRDIVDMEQMIDEYLAFARGQSGEEVAEAAVGTILAEVGADARRTGAAVAVEAEPGLTAALRPKAFKRALANLVNNAAAHGEHVQVAARRTPFGGLEVCVDDDGPGWTRPAARTPKASASASPWPATSPAATVETWNSAPVPWEGCARWCGCRVR